MTILYILHTTDPFSGSTKSFMILLEGVLRAGHKIIVVVPDSGGICSKLQEFDVEFFVVPYKEYIWTSAWNLWQTLLYVPRQIGRLTMIHRACRYLKGQLKDRHIDLVHSNSSIIYLGRYISKQFNKPHLYHIREYGDKDFGFTYFPTNRSFYKHVQTSGVYTVCITKDIQMHFGLFGNPFSRVIYNGIINTAVNYRLENTQRDFLLYAGRLQRTKGFIDLLEAYAQYCSKVDNPLPLKVAGEETDTVYAEEIRSYIFSHSLNDKITFLGKVSNMSELYQGAKATIITSFFEGFGRCMPEAMSYGSIVIGRNTGGTKEQFDNGVEIMGEEIGFRFTTTQELVNNLISLHEQSSNSLQRIQNLAFSCVRRLYTKEAYVNSVLNFYQAILTEKNVII